MAELDELLKSGAKLVEKPSIEGFDPKRNPSIPDEDPSLDLKKLLKFGVKLVDKPTGGREVTKKRYDKKKLYGDISSSKLLNEENTRMLLTAYLKDRAGLGPNDPFDLEAYKKSYLGDASNEKALQVIQNIVNPKSSDAHQVFMDLIKDRAAGKGRQPLEKEGGFFSTPFTKVLEFGTGKVDEGKFVDPIMKAFSESPEDIVAYGNMNLSKDMQDFARNTMTSGVFNEGIFLGPKFTDNERNIFFSYLGALNPAQDLNFMDEVATRVVQSGYDIGVSYGEFGNMLEEYGSSVMNPRMLYLNTKDIKDKTKLREYIEGRVKLRNITLKQGGANWQATALGEADTGQSDEEITNYLMENYDTLIAKGEEAHERKGAIRQYRAAVREHFVQKSLGRDMFMSSVSMGLDLTAAIGLGVVTGGVGAAAHTFVRYAPEMRETLIYSGVNPDDATNIALISAAPYVAAELYGLNALTKFGKSFINGWRPFLKDYMKTYAAEVGEETVQAFVENAAKLYAKEFSDAQGITLSGLSDDIGEQFMEAWKGMAFISLGGTAIRAGRQHLSKTNDYAEIDKMESLAVRAQAEMTDMNVDPIDKSFADVQEFKMMQDVAFAYSDVEIKEILTDAKSEMTVSEAKIKVEANRNVFENFQESKIDLANRKNLEIQEVSGLAERQVTEEVIKESVGEFADVETVEPGVFKIQSKVDGGIDYTVKIIPDADFKAEFGKDKLGVSDSVNKIITLPKSATDFKLVHENLHMMRDLGVISDSELKQLVSDARAIAKPEFLESIKGLDTEGQNQELAANLIEEIKRTGNIPEGLETVWEKVKRWIRDITAQFSGMVEKSGVSIAEDVIAGKPLENGAAKAQAELRFSEEQQTNKDRLDVVDLAKDIIKGKTIPEGTKQSIIDSAQVVANEALQRIKGTPTDPVINEQARRAEIDLFYNKLESKTYQQAFIEGQALAKEEARIKKRIQAEDLNRQKQEKAIEGIEEIALEAANILGIEDFESVAFINDLKAKVAKQVKSKIEASPEAIELNELEETYQNDLADYEINNEIRENLLDVVKAEGGLLLDEDLQEALKETGKLKGWARINLLHKDSGLSWDQMIESLVEAGIVSKGEINGQYDLIHYLDRELKAVKKPKKPKLSRRQKEIKAEYDLLFQGVMQKTLNAISTEMLSDVLPGKQKDSLRKELSKIGKLSTLKSIIDNSLQLIGDINEAKLDQLGKSTLVEEFKGIANGLLKAVKAGREKEIFKNRISEIGKSNNVREYSEKLVKDINDFVVAEAENKNVLQVVNKIAKGLLEGLDAGRVKEMLKTRLTKLGESANIQKTADQLIRDINNAKLLQSKKFIVKQFNKLINRYLKKKISGALNKVKSHIDKDGNLVIDEIDPITHSFLKLTKEVSKLTPDSVESKLKTVQKWMNQRNEHPDEDIQLQLDVWAGKNLDKKDRHKAEIPSLKKSFLGTEQIADGIKEDINTKLIVLQKALIDSGAIKGKTLIEQQISLQRLTEVIEGSLVELAERLEESRKIKELYINDIIPAIIGHGRLPSEALKMFANFNSHVFSMKSGLNLLIQRSSGEQKAKAQKAINEIYEMVSVAENKKDVAVKEKTEELFDAIAEIYQVPLDEFFSRNSADVLSKLMKLEKKYGKYSKQGFNKLSKLAIIQQIATIQQENYQDNTLIQDRAKWNMEKELSPQDLELLQWFKDFNDKERAPISDMSVQILGVPIDMTDPNYVAAAMEPQKTGTTGSFFQGNTMIPPGLTQRVNHQRDLDENKTILDMFLSRNEQNQMFLNGAPTMQVLEMVFNDESMKDAIHETLGKEAASKFYNGVQDWINNGYQNGYNMPWLDTARGYFTAKAFAFNTRIGIKQLTSIPAYALHDDVGLVNTVKYTMSAFTPEGMKAMTKILDIWESIKQRKFVGHALAKERLNLGHTEEMRHLLSLTPDKFRRVSKRAMIFNQMGDIIPIMIVGQGIYRASYEAYTQEGLSDAEASEKAMFKVFEIAQDTQQSGKIKNRSSVQLRGGTFGRTASVFTNTTRQFLEYELVAAQTLAANPTKANAKQLGKAVIINHLLLPAGYQGMNILINVLLGDDFDDDDWLTMAAAIVAGPFAGYVYAGTIIIGLTDAIIKGKRGYNKSFSPMTSLIVDAETIGEIVTADDLSEAIDKFIQLMRGQLAPVREVSKFIKNR